MISHLSDFRVIKAAHHGTEGVGFAGGHPEDFAVMSGDSAANGRQRGPFGQSLL
jgi:hypothetical protein